MSRELHTVKDITDKLGSLCNGGASKEKWEPVRVALIGANNDLALSALKSLKLVDPRE